MSAICGIIHFDGAPVDRADLLALVEGSPYRGPDGTRLHMDGNAGFAHLAFHVSPESVNERQPLVSSDGQLVLVADVRLDNRTELAAMLDIPATALRDTTDPDLLLQAYRTWGEQCLEHLLGDFVFAVWDRHRQELFLARDALGAYSVSWHRAGHTLAFASETAALLDLDRVPAEIDQEVIARILADLPIASDKTEFKDVFYLPPAHFMRVNSAGVSTRRYWDIDPAVRITYKTEDEYSEHFLDLVNTAVACRLRSIRPVGIALSGGYDSTLLAALAASQLSQSSPMSKNTAGQRRLKSFSYVFDRNPSCDERRFIEAVVARYQLDASYVVADEMWSFKDLPKQNIPRATFWRDCYSQFPESIAQAARQAGCGVLLSGDFGDALCGGKSPFAADMLLRGQWGELVSLLYSYRRDMSWQHELFTLGLRPLLPHWLRRGYRKLNPVKLIPFISGLAPERIARLQSVNADGYTSNIIDQLSPGKRQRYAHLLNPGWSQGGDVARSIPYGQCGLESVSPYFDCRLVEYLMAIPTEQLTHPGHYRRLQHNAMKNLLPAVVVQRKEKTSFEPLLQRGLLDKEKANVGKLMQNPLVVSQGWIREDWLKAQLAAGSAWEMDGYPLSMCVHLELWLRAVEDTKRHGKKWSEPYSLA